jgi:hypothetical protein
MENFEGLQSIDNFCKVLVRKPASERFAGTSSSAESMDSGIEEPLVDVFDEGDHIRILVQCRCREQQVTFHPCPDGITVCREDCHREKGGPEVCNDVCRKLTLSMDGLQLDDMLFVIAKCNNNNTLEAMIPKKKK